MRACSTYMDRTRAAIDEYRTLELRRAGIQVTFAVIFGVVALLLLLAAVWVGLTFADSLATPIAHLIRAADRVRAGDLTARVPEIEEGSEIDSLSRAFNRMTDQLASQRAELINANNQLDQRRRFTEAVIGGVSSGRDRPRRARPHHPAEPLGGGVHRPGADQPDRAGR